MKNWKTTTIGILTAVGLLIKNAIALLDNDTATQISFEEIGLALAAFGIGWFAKDAGVTGTEK